MTENRTCDGIFGRRDLLAGTAPVVLGMGVLVMPVRAEAGPGKPEPLLRSNEIIIVILPRRPYGSVSFGRSGICGEGLCVES